LIDDSISLVSLVLAAKGGSLPAKESLYLRYSKAMYNICVRLTGNTDNARDILQDGFELAFGKLQQLNEPAAFGGWLKRIIVNECIAHSKRKINFSLMLTPVMDVADDVDGDWWTRVTMPQLHDAIKQLPDGCRQVFVLYAVEDYSHAAIAEELGIGTGTSKSQYSRARQLLKVILLEKMKVNG
jgi:RNA polymerase sigma factor (sigma-70 family)